VQAAPQHMERLFTSGLLDSGGGLNPFTSGLVRTVLEAGWQDAYLDQLYHVYSQRIAGLHTALQEYLGDQVTYAVPTGGYFFWLRLRAEIDAVRLFERAAAHKVSFRPGVRFSSQDGLHNYVRLSFAYYDEADLSEGVRRLKAAMQEM